MRNILLLVCALFVVFSCAIQKTPSGGPKDESAPEILFESPSNYSLNFNSEKAIIEFNEYISLKDLRSELIVSPSMNTQPNIQVRGKKLYIEFLEELQDSTTYNLQFGNAITDITEGNPVKDFNYVFSTGNYIDSLELKGIVMDAFSKETLSQIKVLLHPVGEDSSIYLRKPQYFSRTSETGSFWFKNLKSGSYLVYALDDQNANYVYDLGEKIAFHDSIIHLPGDSGGFILKLFSEIRPETKILDFDITDFGKLAMKYSKMPNEINPYLYVGERLEKLPYYYLGADSVFVWFNPGTEENQKFIIEADGVYIDTLNVRNVHFKTKHLQLGFLDDLNRSGNLYITVNQPVNKINKERIYIEKDSTLTLRELNISENPGNILKYDLDFAFEMGSNYQIIFLDSAFQDMYSNYSDSSGFGFFTRKPEELGTLEFEYDHKNLAYPVLIQLLDEKSRILKEEQVRESKKLVYEYLVPGNYRVRMVLDENDNGKWDTGNLEDKRQPEDVQYFQKPINLKANWVLVEKLHLD